MDGDDLIHEKMRKPKQPKHPAILRFAAWLIMRIPGAKISSAMIGDYGKHYHTRHIKLSAVIYPIEDDDTYGYIAFYIGHGNFIYWFDKPNSEMEGGEDSE